MTELPEKLYKYRAINKYLIEGIWNLQVYYARHDELNDPFDCNPIIQRRNNEDESHLISIIKEIAKKTKNISSEAAERKIRMYKAKLSKGFINQEGYINGLLDTIKGYLLIHFRKEGVLSLSSSWNNQLMWSHYGDGHKGICIEYITNGHRCNS